MKNIILPTCLQKDCRGSLGEFSNTPYGVFGGDRVKYFPPIPIQSDISPLSIQTYWLTHHLVTTFPLDSFKRKNWELDHE